MPQSVLGEFDNELKIDQSREDNLTKTSLTAIDTERLESKVPGIIDSAGFLDGGTRSYSTFGSLPRKQFHLCSRTNVKTQTSDVPDK
jgi:hypothetical protein